MRRWLLLLVAAAHAGAWLAAAGEADSEDSSEEAEQDDDSDSAPFMIVVEHNWGEEESGYWRCSGALVSLRTGVTSAACARPARANRGEVNPLWVLAAAAASGLAPRSDGARRVTRIATAGTGAVAVGNAPWGGATLDIAVVEIDQPFGSAARARPILMATSTDECGGPGTICHVVRSLPMADSEMGQHRVRLRIVDAVLAAESVCAPLMRFWSALLDRALCLSGPELCTSDYGAGVVCGGKLCGIVSRTARAADGVTTGTRSADGPDCGDRHAAHSVARWRRFLHCAHTLRACGRGACAELCSEQRLDESNSSGSSGNEVSPGPLPPSVATKRFQTVPPPASEARSRPSSAVDLAHLAPPQDAGDGPMSIVPPTRRHERPLMEYDLDDTPTPARELTPTDPTEPRITPTRTFIKTPEPESMTALSTMSSLEAAPFTNPSSVRPTPLFGPYKPDIKEAGEYVDNAADYGPPMLESGRRVQPSPRATLNPSPQPSRPPPPRSSPKAQRLVHGKNRHPHKLSLGVTDYMLAPLSNGSTANTMTTTLKQINTRPSDDKKKRLVTDTSSFPLSLSTACFRLFLIICFTMF